MDYERVPISLVVTTGRKTQIMDSKNGELDRPPTTDPFGFFLKEASLIAFSGNVNHIWWIWASPCMPLMHTDIFQGISTAKPLCAHIYIYMIYGYVQKWSTKGPQRKLFAVGSETVWRLTILSSKAIHRYHKPTYHSLRILGLLNPQLLNPHEASVTINNQHP